MSRTSKTIFLLFLAYIAFISLGLPDGLLGVAWPSIRKEFALPLSSLGLLLAASTAGYLTSSFFAGRLMARLGVGGLLAASCFATGMSLLGYTLVPGWGWIVALGVLAGLGAGAIDAGINTYIASEHSETLMQWLHASFGVGVTLGPIIMTTGLAAFASWRWGYTVVGVAQVTLAVIFLFTRGQWRRSPSPAPAPASETSAGAPVAPADPERRLLDYKTGLLETLRQPMVWFSVLMFFVYCGIELSFGHWTYTLLTESRHVPASLAGLFAGSYWATFTVGRILAGWAARKTRIETLLWAGVFGALAGALLVLWNPSQWVSLTGVALTGFSVAPIFPGMVSTTAQRVSPRYAANTIGMQISAAGLGGALLPGLAGVLAQNFGLEVIPLFLVALIVLLIVLFVLSKK